MRKALLPMIASLALCGTATAALIGTNARAAQTVHKPVMIAQASSSDAGGAPPMQDGMMGGGRAQLCKDMYAHRVGELAFLEAKLSLNATQAPLFGRWKQASLDIAEEREASCGSHERRARRPNVVERLGMEEELLKKRLADIEAERPALAAFYGSLNPAQKEEFGHGDMRRMAGRMHMMMGMIDRTHPGMGPERMERPMGAPPPPPAQ